MSERLSDKLVQTQDVISFLSHLCFLIQKKSPVGTDSDAERTAQWTPECNYPKSGSLYRDTMQLF